MPERVDEHLVDLDVVDAELEHIGQAAVAGADIVDRNLAAEFLQRRDHAPRRCQVVERLALGDFKHDLRQPRSASREDLAHLRDDLVAVKCSRGRD